MNIDKLEQRMSDMCPLSLKAFWTGLGFYSADALVPGSRPKPDQPNGHRINASTSRTRDAKQNHDQRRVRDTLVKRATPNPTGQAIGPTAWQGQRQNIFWLNASMTILKNAEHGVHPREQ